MANTNEKEDRPGAAVDSTGGPTFDPSRNVLDLVEAAIKRQDDLRAASDVLNESRLEAVIDIANLRAEHVVEIGKLETRRIDNLRDVQLQHVEEMAVLRERHAEKSQEQEARRINAIRDVDVGSVATAASRQDQQAVVLANQVATSAETLRSLVATTNAAVAANMAQIASQLSERMAQLDKIGSDRITQLEKTSYEGKGKEAVSDPMLARLYAEMRAMNEFSSTSTGKGSGMNYLWGIIVAAIAAVGVIVMMFDKVAR